MLPDSLTYEEWLVCGQVLLRLDEAQQWWTGDWWNTGVRYGQRERACIELGLDYGTAANAGRVAAHFDFSRRREKLSFTHHAEACSVSSPQEQDRLLLWCEETIGPTGRARSTRELRSAIIAAERQPSPRRAGAFP